MRNHGAQKTVREDPAEVMVDGVRFWHECQEEGQAMRWLPIKLVFTADNLNGTLLFFEAHGISYSAHAVAQIRREIEAHGEADVWLCTQKAEAVIAKHE